MIQKELWPSSQMMFTLHRRCSLLDSRSSFHRIVEILQVKVESLLSVEQLIVYRRLEFPAHFYADILDCAIARLCRITDFHCLRHGSVQWIKWTGQRRLLHYDAWRQLLEMK